jgi:4Fe-4S ferredoxin
MKQLKSETENELKVERIHIVKRYSLTLDKNLCKGCGICKIICPKEAIEIKKIPKSSEEEKAKHPIIDVDKEKCIYCGMCDAMCPFGALRIRVNGEHVIPVIRTQSFPQIIRDIEIDTKKCEVGCSDCEKGCPLNIIKTIRVSPLERAREILRAKKDKNVKLRPLVDVRSDLCAGCRLCEIACPQKAIRALKIFHGSIKINHEKCPKGCKDCLDVCPFSVALYLAEDGKVHANELHCTYCGVCRMVCPVEGALEIQRQYIHHTPVRSGAWNKALEKLTSTKELAKELRAKSQAKARETVQRRFTSETSP